VELNSKFVCVERMLKSADFERVLRTGSSTRSEHFSLHFVLDASSKFIKSSLGIPTAKPFTCHGQDLALVVHELEDPPHLISLGSIWLGLVVPKRHARSSVTRNLLKRQIRGVVTRHAQSMSCGLWVVRLRAPFSTQEFISSASFQLRQLARTELDQLIRCSFSI
jgi:ribonuclease P protein component